MFVDHQNFFTDQGYVYCRKEGTIGPIDLDRCSTCALWFGALQGEGVECEWDDAVDWLFLEVTDPVAEKLRVSKLIDEGKIDAIPKGRFDDIEIEENDEDER